MAILKHPFDQILSSNCVKGKLTHEERVHILHIISIQNLLIKIKVILVWNFYSKLMDKFKIYSRVKFIGPNGDSKL